MNSKYSIAEAKDHLPKLVREAEAGYVVEMTRHGKPVAVVLSTAEYARLKQPKRDFWESIQAWRERWKDVLEEWDPDPDEIFYDPQRKEVARDFSFDEDDIAEDLATRDVFGRSEKE